MVRFARRRAALPADAAQDLGLARGDRVLAWARLVGGGLAAATLGGIRVRTPRGALIERTWVEVEHAEWHADSGTLVIWWVDGRQLTPLELEPDPAPQLPVAVRERVQSSVLLTTQVAVGGGTVRVALRRAADGALLTQALPTSGVSAADPEVVTAVRRAMAALRAQAGAEEDLQAGDAPGFDTLHDARGDPA